MRGICRSCSTPVPRRWGWAAFVTSAINEADIEQAFGMDPLVEGPLAVCGFGWRADTMSTTEFDPTGEVWGR